MGIWRIEDAGFTIQLSDDEEEDAFLAVYIQFVDPETMATKLEELHSAEPELFEHFPIECFTDGIRTMDMTEPENPDGRQPFTAPR